MGFLDWLSDFFCEADGSSSMCRLLAFACVVIAAVVALRCPSCWEAITALVGGGAVALLVRTRVPPPSG